MTLPALQNLYFDEFLTKYFSKQKIDQSTWICSLCFRPSPVFWIFQVRRVTLKSLFLLPGRDVHEAFSSDEKVQKNAHGRRLKEIYSKKAFVSVNGLALLPLHIK